MAINMMCMNSKCKFYWEDCCTKSMNEEHMVIDDDGTCLTFEAGVSDWYKDEKDNMTRDEKLQAIEDMGISISGDCTINYGLRDVEKGCMIDCNVCWITTLEGGRIDV